MDMSMKMPAGAPWLSMPVMLHSDRSSTCSLTKEQCAYQRSYWRFWYIADWVYALNSVYFFIAIIAVFGLCRVAVASAPTRFKRWPLWTRTVSVVRFLAARSFRLFHWYSAPLGVLALGVVGFVFFAAMTLGPQPYYWPTLPKGKYGSSPPIATRAGWMATGILPFVVALPAKMNLITAVTGVSHEKLQVFHRWTAYAMFILALIHTFPFIIYHISIGDMVMQWNTSVFYWTGVVALLAQAWLTFASWAPLRNRFYELFKFSHYLSALVFVVFYFLHCNFRLTSWDYFIATGVLFSLSFLGSCLRMLQEHGMRTAHISLLPCQHVHISIPVRTKHTQSEWTVGQHVFIRFAIPSLHSASSHPFTICSLEDSGEMTFFIKPHKGITRHLAKLAETHGTYKCNVLLDGPYGGLTNSAKTLATYDKNVLIAGGSGAGFVLPLVEDVLKRRVWNDCKTRLTVILSTREHETLYWIKAEIRQLFARYKAYTPDDVPTVTIHLTSDAGATLASASKDVEAAENQAKTDEEGKLQLTFSRDLECTDSASSDKEHDNNTRSYLPQFDVRFGRSNLTAAIKTEVEKSTGSVAVAVCGPQSMLFDVQNAVADMQMAILSGHSSCSDVYLHTEHFGL